MALCKADYGRAAGTCLPALSPEGCVAQSARWCASCDRCVAFDTLFSESTQFHSCAGGHINSRGNNWDLYLKNESFGTPTRFVVCFVEIAKRWVSVCFPRPMFQLLSRRVLKRFSR